MSRQIYAVCLKCLFFLVLLVSIGLPALGQSASSAAVSGIVQDTTDARISNASVKLINTDTGTESHSTTSRDGDFSIPSVLPGHYRLQIERNGFDTTQLTGITLNVGDNKNVIIRMKVGSSQQTITVDASGLNINTTDATVSTVVDRHFVENMPLNGRSFQSLILLAPGVVTNNPQTTVGLGQTGEFSINGQRTDANYYTVDGVSANNAVFAGDGSRASSAGGLATSSALGSTQALVSIDALQEFRINTSTYTAEYGRQPGGQIQFETRSGTNAFHGTAFDYLRNAIFDANNWFNDYGKLPKPAERQNDFGGVLGGPLTIPELYSGKDRTFFFFSYEGLRLSEPEPATVSYVPTNNPASPSPYGNLRNTVPAALQPVLNAFPLPNCTVAQDPQCIDDSAEGLSPYIISTSLPSSIDAISVRGDHVVAPWLRLFFRYGDTESSAVSSITVYKSLLDYSTRNYTLGADGTLFGTLSNQFRFNYSPTRAISTDQTTALGGGTPVDMLTLQGLDSGESFLELLSTKEYASILQGQIGTPQHQWNLVDTIGWLLGRDDFCAGIDYRRTTSYLNAGSLADTPYVAYLYFSPANTLSNNVNYAESQIAARQDPAFTNFSAFVQDEWRAKPRLRLSLGLRWELNPPPTVVSGVQQRTLNGSFNNPASLALAPSGTALYSTTYYNLSPRLGLAATLHNRPGHETVVRAGGGIYFDTGQSLEALIGANGPGAGLLAHYGTSFGKPASFPLPPNLINVPLAESLVPPYAAFYTVSQNLQLPYTYQWNAGLEQSLGSEQSVTIGYIGSNGRRLIELQQFTLAALNPSLTTIYRYQNGLSSSYNALQAQYKRRLSNGLQALVSYTWSHALDFQSADAGGLLPYQRGNSDFDVRSNFTAAVSYDLPSSYHDAWKHAVLSQWGLDLRFTARTAFPVEIEGPALTDPNTGNQYYGLLNYNNSLPLYLKQAGVPGGRVVNAAAFSTPLAGQTGNAPRNFVRGFGENEVNLAIRREFPLYEQVHLLFRAEAFNILNHPNFGFINANCGNPPGGETCTNPTFGQATSTLANSLGGLAPIYQQGGPRSMQFALKLRF
jgi:hypothetical protein